MMIKNAAQWRVTPFRERLLSGLIIQPDGCVLWSRAKTPEGYGKLGRDGKTVLVHRAMYELFAGPIPAGMQLDHLCRNRACANVAHLEPVTHRENWARGQAPSVANAAKTHCPKGHPYDEVNGGRRARGDRYCRACQREYQRAHYVPVGGKS